KSIQSEQFHVDQVDRSIRRKGVMSGHQSLLESKHDEEIQITATLANGDIMSALCPSVNQRETCLPQLKTLKRRRY
ncbi:hypothetical protein KPH14_013143, partial [Odynerus spinipes]